MLIGRSACEGTSRSGNQNRLPLLILCTSGFRKSRWVGAKQVVPVLRYAAEYKDLDEPLGDFIKHQRAGSTNARNGLAGVLEEVASIEAQRVRSRDLVAPVHATDSVTSLM